MGERYDYSVLILYLPMRAFIFAVSSPLMHELRSCRQGFGYVMAERLGGASTAAPSLETYCALYYVI